MELMRMDLTPAAYRALEAAGPRPTVGRLLTALLAEEEGRAASWLAQVGVSLETARNWTPADSPIESLHLLTAAADLAISLDGDPTVGSDHLFLALVGMSASLKQRLDEAKIDSERWLRPSTPLTDPIGLDTQLNLEPAPPNADVARILDAAANRAREGLRVVEDYCRFVLDDAGLSRMCKELRHSIADLGTRLGGNTLVAARNTPGDVGTTIQVERETQRSSAAEVAIVNLKRLQESLRSLEENSKTIDSEVARGFEQARYRSYSLEQSLSLGLVGRDKLRTANLYVLVSGEASATTLEFLIKEAAAGGADAIQLREKRLSDCDLLARARQFRRWTRQAGVLLIINDRPDIARLADADGVHVGQDDLPLPEVRQIVGPEAIVGVSTHDLDQVRRAVLAGASYIGVGPVYASSTKSFDSLPGLDFVHHAMRETSLPAFALGGISVANLGAVRRAGATRVAVSAAICQADEPRLVAAALKEQLRFAGAPS